MTETATSNSQSSRFPLNPSTLGTIYCILSAVFYTLMEICRRELSENCDPVWVNCVQASVSTVVFGIYLTFQSARGRSAWPPLGVAIGLMMLGAITQLGGTSYQWSLGQIGLSIGNPLQMGVMLAVAAILGLLILPTYRDTMSIHLCESFIAAIFSIAYLECFFILYIYCWRYCQDK